LVKTNSETLNLAVVTDELHTDTCDKNVDTKPHVEDDNKAAINESDEENMQPSVGMAPDASVGIVDEGNEENMPSSAAA
jgi:alpha-D-ribose 1-methylphosphonate 5-triphosphate diphosphatase PhnM